MSVGGCRRCILHNLRYDEQVASFANAAGAGLEADAGMAARDGKDGLAGGGSACTALSFRTGGTRTMQAAPLQRALAISLFNRPTLMLTTAEFDCSLQ